MSSTTNTSVHELPTHGVWDEEGRGGPVQREAQRLYEEALACLRSNRDAEAAALLQQVLGIAPRHAGAMSWLGLVAARLHAKHAEAVTLCRRAFVLAPENPEVATNLGRVQRLSGDNAAAHRSFLHAYRSDPVDPAAAAELARMGVRRSPVLRFLPRAHWCNRVLGLVRYRLRVLVARPARGPRF